MASDSWLTGTLSTCMQAAQLLGLLKVIHSGRKKGLKMPRGEDRQWNGPAPAFAPAMALYWIFRASWWSSHSPHILQRTQRHCCHVSRLHQLTSRRCRPSTGTGCPAAMLSVNQVMSSRAGQGHPGCRVASCSCQQTASSAEVCSITTCVTSELAKGEEGEAQGPTSSVSYL